MSDRGTTVVLTAEQTTQVTAFGAGLGRALGAPRELWPTNLDGLNDFLRDYRNAQLTVVAPGVQHWPQERLIAVIDMFCDNCVALRWR